MDLFSNVMFRRRGRLAVAGCIFLSIPMLVRGATASSHGSFETERIESDTPDCVNVGSYEYGLVVIDNDCDAPLTVTTRSCDPDLCSDASLTFEYAEEVDPDEIGVDTNEFDHEEQIDITFAVERGDEAVGTVEYRGTMNRPETSGGGCACPLAAPPPACC